MYRAYVQQGAPAGTPVVWAKRVGDAVVVLPQDEGYSFPMDARHFDRVFTPTA